MGLLAHARKRLTTWVETRAACGGLKPYAVRCHKLSAPCDCGGITRSIGISRVAGYPPKGVFLCAGVASWRVLPQDRRVIRAKHREDVDPGDSSPRRELAHRTALQPILEGAQRHPQVQVDCASIS